MGFYRRKKVLKYRKERVYTTLLEKETGVSYAEDK